MANPTQRGTARKGREQGRQDRMAREAMERAEKYAPGLSLDMPDEEPVKKMKKGGKVHSSASKRADGCAVRGKTRGKMV